MGSYTSRSTTHGKVRDFGNALKRTEAGDRLLKLALSRLDNRPEVLKAVNRYIATNRSTVDHVSAVAASHGKIHETAIEFAHALMRLALGFGG